MFPLASVATSPGRLNSPLPVPPGTPHVNSNVPQLHSPQLPPQPSSPHTLPVQFGVQHTPNFAVGAFAHRRLQQLWLVRQVRPSGLQPPASASRCPPSVSTTAARRNARATCFITHLPARKQARVRLLQDATIPRSPTGVKRSPGRDPASSGLGRSMASSAQRASAPAVARGAPPPLPCAPENRRLCREGTPDPPQPVPSMRSAENVFVLLRIRAYDGRRGRCQPKRFFALIISATAGGTIPSQEGSPPSILARTSGV